MLWKFNALFVYVRMPPAPPQKLLVSFFGFVDVFKFDETPGGAGEESFVSWCFIIQKSFTAKTLHDKFFCFIHLVPKFRV